MDCGKKIAQLRKSQNMTQEELGKVLSVTYQAVSKWERGESLPDFEMMSRIAKFFNVPLNYFSDEEEGEQAETATTATATAAGEAPTANIVGMCTQCGKMLTEDEIAEKEPKIICKSCSERLKAQAEKLRADNEIKERARKDKAIYEQRGHGVDVSLIVSMLISFAVFIGLAIFCFKVYDKEDGYANGALLFFVPLAIFGAIQALCDFIKEERETGWDNGPEFYSRNVSLIAAGIFAAANLICMLILYILSKHNFYLVMIFVSTIFSFTFVSQFLWGGVVKETFTAGGFTFSLPGFIITLDIDSILWMIIVKFLLGILAAVIFIVTTVIVAAVAMLISLIMFVPSILHKSLKDKKVEKENQ